MKHFTEWLQDVDNEIYNELFGFKKPGFEKTGPVGKSKARGRSVAKKFKQLRQQTKAEERAEKGK